MSFVMWLSVAPFDEIQVEQCLVMTNRLDVDQEPCAGWRRHHVCALSNNNLKTHWRQWFNVRIRPFHDLFLKVSSCVLMVDGLDIDVVVERVLIEENRATCSMGHVEAIRVKFLVNKFGRSFLSNEMPPPCNLSFEGIFFSASGPRVPIVDAGSFLHNWSGSDMFFVCFWRPFETARCASIYVIVKTEETQKLCMKFVLYRTT